MKTKIEGTEIRITNFHIKSGELFKQLPYRQGSVFNEIIEILVQNIVESCNRNSQLINYHIDDIDVINALEYHPDIVIHVRMMFNPVVKIEFDDNLLLVEYLKGNHYE